MEYLNVNYSASEPYPWLRVLAGAEGSEINGLKLNNDLDMNFHDIKNWLNPPTGSTTFNALTDTLVTTPATGEELYWNGTAWGHRVKTLDQLDDVINASSAAINSILMKNANGPVGKWDTYNHVIGNISDVKITAPILNDQILIYNNTLSKWENKPVPSPIKSFVSLFVNPDNTIPTVCAVKNTYYPVVLPTMLSDVQGTELTTTAGKIKYIGTTTKQFLFNFSIQSYSPADNDKLFEFALRLVGGAIVQQSRMNNYSTTNITLSENTSHVSFMAPLSLNQEIELVVTCREQDAVSTIPERILFSILEI